MRMLRATLCAAVISAAPSFAAHAEDIVVSQWGVSMAVAEYAVALDQGFFKAANAPVTDVVSSQGGGTAVRTLLVAKGAMDGLSDVAGLAYSPKTKKWYATDFSWVAPDQGGLFELAVAAEDGEGGQKNLKITKKKLLTLDKPTACAFDKDGNLYVAVFGTGKEGDQMSPGQLLKINADQFK